MCSASRSALLYAPASLPTRIYQRDNSHPTRTTAFLQHPIATGELASHQAVRCKKLFATAGAKKQALKGRPPSSPAHGSRPVSLAANRGAPPKVQLNSSPAEKKCPRAPSEANLGCP